MAKKPTITSITSGYASTNTLNDNFEALRDAFDNTLSLDGSTPNSMTSDLNLNNNDILNASRILVGGVDYIATALSYKNAAEAAQTAAETAQAAAELVYDNFDDRYLGSKASDPTLDNDGDALLDGALYYDTINTVMKFYDTSTSTWYRTTPTTSDQANIDIVAGNTTNINTVAGISSDVTTVAGISSDVTTVAADGTDIGTVATSISNVNTAATNISNINTVAGISANVTTVAGNTSNINTVATDISNVNTVAGQTTNLQNVTDNLTAIQNAATNATNAATSASNAATSASNASTSETNAASSATSAAASAAAAASSADFFDDVYLGSKASDPSVDNDGDPLNAGDLYFNTTSNNLKVYSGSAWQDAAVDSSGFVQTTGDSMTGNLSFGDNDKAIFGAGSDLQIYHDGSNSYISEVGTGDLYVRGSNFYITKPDGSLYFSGSNSTGEAGVYFNNSKKLATTSTGVDITGTLTSDGLTVESNNNSTGAIATLSNTNISTDGNTVIGVLVFENNDDSAGTTNAEIKGMSAGTAGQTNLYIRTGSSGTLYNRAKFDYTGDISFYEDTGTTAKFFWDASAENLGIGKTAPTASLHTRKSTGSDGLRIETSNTDNGFIHFADPEDDNAGRLVYSHSDNSMRIHTSGTERMRIDSSGRVGIGTTSPSSKLTISDTGSSLFSPNAYIAGATADVMRLGFDSGGARTNIVSGRDSGTSGATNGYMAFETRQSGGGMTEAMRIDSSGNVGIGTSSLGYTGFADNLTIADSSNGGLTIRTGASAQGAIYFSDTTGDVAGQYAGFLVYNHSGNHMALGTSSTEAMRIDSSGRVGIGTSSPSTKVHLKGDWVSNEGQLVVDANSGQQYSGLTLQNNGTAKFFLYHDNTNNLVSIYGATGQGLVFSTDDAERMRIDSSGNVLVGKTSATGFGSTAGFEVLSDGRILSTVSGDQALALSRTTSDGNIAEFYKDGSTVGSIGVDAGDLLIGTGVTGLRFNDGADEVIPRNTTGAQSAGVTSLGNSSSRFKDLYLSGGVYLGGTGSANKLDDYEEGTWTPTLLGVTGVTYQDQIGSYTKIGNFVHLSFQLRATWTASGNSYIGGIPFTSRNNSNDYGTGGFFTIQQPERTTVRASMFIQPNSSSISLYEIDGHTHWALPSATANYLNGNVFYRV